MALLSTSSNPEAGEEYRLKAEQARQHAQLLRSLIVTRTRVASA